MHIVITGFNGFIGSALAKQFISSSNTVSAIKRITSETTLNEIVEQIEKADVIINLAGAPIVGRWTESYKKELLNSRIITTSKLVSALALLPIKPKLFISTSAVGIYDSEGENTEFNLRYASNFLATICERWEAEAAPVVDFTRLVIFRLGVVLDSKSGALKRMLPLFRLGLGGVIAEGKQGFPWVHIVDVVRAFEYAIENEKMAGVYNLAAPELVNNLVFTKTLASVLNRPAFIPVPEFALKILFGEGAIAVTSGQFVIPKRLLESNFEFKYPHLLPALQSILLK